MITKEYIFLLGGHDLEMLTIRQLLEIYEQAYVDKQLSWGACLSAYNDYLQMDGKTFVGIELIYDKENLSTIPDNYIDIDHHNERSNEPSSIEQIAHLLGITLNREQLLIAANDKGYIPAMQKSGASSAEIERIRKMDRKAQGVNEEDEHQAIIDIKNNLLFRDNIYEIYTKIHHFSPITDHLFGQYDHLIVYTDKELTYYGIDKNKLVSHFIDLIKQNKAYSGGLDANGFFGIGKGHFDKAGIETFLKEIKGILKKKQNEY